MNYLMWVKAPRPHGATADPSGIGQLLITAYLIFWAIRTIRKHIKK